MNVLKLINIHKDELIDKLYPFSQHGFQYISSSYKSKKSIVIDAYTNNKYQYLNKYIEQYTTWYYLPQLTNNDFIFFSNYRFLYLSEFDTSKLYLCFSNKIFKKYSSFLYFNKCNNCGLILELMCDFLNNNKMLNWFKISNYHFYSFFAMPSYQYNLELWPIINNLIIKFNEFIHIYSNFFNSSLQLDNGRLYGHIFEWLISYYLYEFYNKHKEHIINMPLQYLTHKSLTKL